MRLASWAKHLKNKRGSQFVLQMARMWNFHRTSFDEIVQNIFDAIDPYDAKFTFPTVASVAPYEPELIKYILDQGHEIANHGYKHVKYPHLSDRAQEVEFEKSVKIFEKLNIPIHGFRAPYNNYNEKTIELVEKFGFEWDGGVGYRPEYRHGNEMFYYNFENGETSSFVNIPCHRYSDDLLIDYYYMTPRDISKLLRAVVQKAAKTGGVIMFDLHPIRIGQKKYSFILNDLAKMTANMDGWMPTTIDAVRQWKDTRSWKDDKKFCLLMTGDIDNFVFFDYLRRLV